MQKLNHYISANQVEKQQFLEELFAAAADFQKNDTRNNDLRSKVLATLFFEASTRTRLSFESAMLRLGGQVISSENASDFSSAKKGETLEDTIRIVEGYADCIVLRHPKKGSARLAAEVSGVPVVNAGDGSGEHPTQALVDLYTIQKERGQVSGAVIALVGDLLHGRTIHSLVQLLALYKSIQIILVSPARLRLPEVYKARLQAYKVPFRETEDFTGALKEADVVYMTRIQKERFESETEYNQLKGAYVFGEDELQLLKKDAILMHPLPRVDEVSQTVDKDSRAAYFRQARNGLCVRMALLRSLLSNGRPV